MRKTDKKLRFGKETLKNVKHSNLARVVGGDPTVDGGPCVPVFQISEAICEISAMLQCG